MRTLITLLLVLAAAAPVLAGEPGPATIMPTGVGGLPFNATCEQPVETVQDGEITFLVFRQNVVFTHGDAALFADAAVVWITPATGAGERGVKVVRFYAEGNVLLRQGDMALHAARLLGDRERYTAVLMDARVKLPESLPNDDPLYLRARSIAFKGKSGLLLEEGRPSGDFDVRAADASISTCSFGEPHYAVVAREIFFYQRSPAAGETRPETEGHMRNTVLRVHGLPVFYVPYLPSEVRHVPLVYLRTGSTSDLGVFAQAGWGLEDAGLYRSHLVDVIAQTDFFSERGFGIGGTMLYLKRLSRADQREEMEMLDGRFERRELSYDEYQARRRVIERNDFEGDLFGYYINDQGLDNELWEPETRNRWRIRYYHRHYLPLDFRGDLEIAYFSDQRFYEEFFEEEFKTAKPPENLVYINRSQGNLMLSLLERHRLNTFETSTDYTPELSVRVLEQPLMDGMVLVRSENSFGVLQRKFAEDRRDPVTNQLLPNRNNTPQSWRVDSENEVSVPFAAGPINLRPRAGFRFTGWQEQADGSGGIGRFMGFGGVDAGFSLWRDYPRARSDVLQVDGLRHIFSPQVEWLTYSGSSTDPGDLIQFDRVEAMDEFDLLTVRLRNQLVTHRHSELLGDRVVEFLDSEVEIRQYVGDGLGREGGTTEIEPTVSWQASDLVKIDLDALITSESGGNRYGIGCELRPPVPVSDEGRWDQPLSPYARTPRMTYPWRLFLGNRYLEDESNIITGIAEYAFSEKWSVFVREDYDTEEIGNLRSTVGLARTFHCWLFELAVEIDEPDDEFTVSLTVSPTSFLRTRARSRISGNY